MLFIKLFRSHIHIKKILSIDLINKVSIKCKEQTAKKLECGKKAKYLYNNSNIESVNSNIESAIGLCGKHMDNYKTDYFYQNKGKNLNFS